MPTSKKAQAEAYIGKKVPTHRVMRARLHGAHNCCGPCADAIRGAILGVKGVIDDTVQPGRSDFEVMGDFVPAELIEALHGAGFHAEIET